MVKIKLVYPYVTYMYYSVQITENEFVNIPYMLSTDDWSSLSRGHIKEKFHYEKSIS